MGVKTYLLEYKVGEAKREGKATTLRGNTGKRWVICLPAIESIPLKIEKLGISASTQTHDLI